MENQNNTKNTLAFSMHGTLVDTNGVLPLLEKIVGIRAVELSQMWHAKRIEYTLRRKVMNQQCSFSNCLRTALDFSCNSLGIPIKKHEKNNLLEAYKHLPAHPEVKAALEDAKKREFKLYVFTNGGSLETRKLLTNAGLVNYFDGIVSTDEVSTIKPDPDAYYHFMKNAGTYESRTWVVSATPSDVVGAISCGLKSAWVRRSPNKIFDPWEFSPTISMDCIASIGEKIEKHTVRRDVMGASPKDLFNKSLSRCAKSRDFIPSFYDKFISSSDEIAERFKDTSFERQNGMLLKSLKLTAYATSGNAMALKELRERAESHSRHHLNIEPRFYHIWKSSLMETAREFDNLWDDETEQAWDSILGHVIGLMTRYY